MRIVGGQYRSRILKSLPGVEIRPTSDRLRETLFNVLCGGDPEALTGSTWLDLYAGTGAIGIEALSRGARMVQFVELSQPANEVIAANLKSLGITAGFKIVRTQATRALRQLDASIEVDYAFLDPPYSVQDEYTKTLGLLGASMALRAGGIVIAEHQKRFDPGEAHANLKRYRTLKQGDAALSFYRKHYDEVPSIKS